MNAPAIKTDQAGKIFAAMASIMGRVGAVAKGRKNTDQGYQYRGIEDLYAALQGLMAEHGVFSLPTVEDVRREERTTRNGGVLTFTQLRVRYTFYADDGSSLEAVVCGEGMDSSDKSTNKAMSGAEKYCLLQAFKIPTAELRDSEEENPRPAARQPAQPPSPRHPAAPPAPAAPVQRFTTVVHARLKERQFASDEIEDAVRAIAESYEVRTLDDLPAEARAKVLRGIGMGQADRWRQRQLATA